MGKRAAAGKSRAAGSGRAQAGAQDTAGLRAGPHEKATVRAVEMVAVDELVRHALRQARERYIQECEAIAQMAARREGRKEVDGWKLDIDRLMWFRPKPEGDGASTAD